VPLLANVFYLKVFSICFWSFGPTNNKFMTTVKIDQAVQNYMNSVESLHLNEQTDIFYQPKQTGIFI
jgi:hypothetical protein